MYDRVTLDQLRAFVMVTQEGSFSAAARKLRRVQSAISTSMANLEDELGVKLWDRSTKIAKLTPQGRAVLASARRVLASTDDLRTLASEMHGGLEPSVSLCVDALFPLETLVDVCARFAKAFPTVDLRVDTQVLSAVSAAVVSGQATIGVVGPLPIPAGFEHRELPSIQMITVVAPKHALAAYKKRIPTARLAEQVQIVLSERSEAGVPDQAVLSPRTWRVADLQTKHAMLRAGLGWGNLPEHVAREDVKKKRLVVIHPEAWGKAETRVAFFAIYRAGAFGPAHRWVLDHLRNR
jgi:DNA-binding transcriptional LysR family regulator